MGVKYTSQSSSGYDANSPPDDGTQSEANKCKWSGIKDSLTDVLKLFTENINTELLAFFDFDTNAQSGSYTTLTSDNGKTLECTGSGTITLGATATMTRGYEVTIKCVSGTETVSTGETIDGSASDRTVAAGDSETYVVNATDDGYLIKGHHSATANFPSATRMIFQQTAAPTGWTKDTTSVNERALRVVSGTASAGGSVGFTTAFSSSRSTSSESSHTHGAGTLTNSSPSGTASVAGGGGSAASSVHIHTITGSTAIGSSHSHTSNLAVLYLDVIIADKD